MKKAIYFGSLPETLHLEERFKLLKEAGYHGTEIGTVGMEEVVRLKNEADRVGIEIHSIMNSLHWKFPLTELEVKDRCIKNVEVSIEYARIVGADAVLLVPGVVNEKVSYKVAYERSFKVIKEEILPMAIEKKVTIAIENVWNKFLLSPLEFTSFIDSFESPYIGAYFDVGNILLYGYPQDWIRTLGKRIKKVHIKGFNIEKRDFCYLLEGSIDWKEVENALIEVGYDGYITAEMSPYPSHPEQMIRDTSKHMDLIFKFKDT